MRASHYCLKHPSKPIQEATYPNSKADLYWTLVQWIGSPCSLICGVLIGFALYSKKEEPGIELYLAERIANMEVKGLVTSRLKP
jgi:hypothetical protein